MSRNLSGNFGIYRYVSFRMYNPLVGNGWNEHIVDVDAKSLAISLDDGDKEQKIIDGVDKYGSHTFKSRTVHKDGNVVTKELKDGLYVVRKNGGVLRAISDKSAVLLINGWRYTYERSGSRWSESKVCVKKEGSAFSFTGRWGKRVTISKGGNFIRCAPTYPHPIWAWERTPYPNTTIGELVGMVLGIGVDKRVFWSQDAAGAYLKLSSSRMLRSKTNEKRVGELLCARVGKNYARIEATDSVLTRNGIPTLMFTWKGENSKCEEQYRVRNSAFYPVRWEKGDINANEYYGIGNAETRRVFMELFGLPKLVTALGWSVIENTERGCIYDARTRNGEEAPFNVLIVNDPRGYVYGMQIPRGIVSVSEAHSFLAGLRWSKEELALVEES